MNPYSLVAKANDFAVESGSSLGPERLTVARSQHCADLLNEPKLLPLK
jgi:hypothetical protein